jgi:MraZ protein
MTQWEALQDRLSVMRSGTKNERTLRTVFMASAHELEVDGAGRVLLPQMLRDYANIDQDVSINGSGERLEIWDQAAWNDTFQSAAANMSELAEGADWL